MRNIWLCPIIRWVQGWDWCCDQWIFFSVLVSWDALLEFGRLVWSVMDLMVVLIICGCFWRLLSESRQCWMVYLICCNVSTKQPISRFAFWKFRFSVIQSIIFSEVLIENSNGWWDINSFVLSFFGVRCWGWCWSWWKFCSSMAFLVTLLGIVSLAGLGMDQVVLFFLCNFFWGLGMLKMPETIVLWRHWFGHSLRPGKPLNSPRWCGGRHDGAEDAIFTKQYHTCLHWANNEAICLTSEKCDATILVAASHWISSNAGILQYTLKSLVACSLQTFELMPNALCEKLPQPWTL